MASKLQLILEILGKSSSGEQAAKKTKEELRALQKQADQASVRLSKMNLAARQLGNGLRMLGQAAQTAGATLTMFVSIPLGAALKEGAAEAIGYENALVRVQKTTSLGTEAIKELSRNLLQLGRFTSTPIQDLARLGEVAGQMGFRAINAITRVVEVANMLAVATDLASEDAARSLGKIASAFGYAGDKGAKIFGQLATTINRMENEFNATAPEIVQAMLNMASGAHQLGLSMAESAAMASVLVAAGVSARMAGTELNRLFVAIVQNISEVAQLLGTSSAELKARLETDAIGVIMELLKRINLLESGTEELRIGTELFGIRAGKAVGSLAANYDQLENALGLANNEWESGTSLITEYATAAQSTKEQLGILVNNLRVAAVTIASDFLPKVVELVRFAVPGIQRLVEAFSSLSPRVRGLIVGFAAVLTVAGPMALLFGNLLFVLGMFAGAVINIVTALSWLASSSAILIPLITAIIAAIGIGLLSATDVGREALLELAKIIDEYISQASQWGEGLVGNIAMGMLEGAKYVIEACIYVGEIIAGFFAAASPPKMGPLKQIGQWGTRLIDTYLQAFKRADFGVLDYIGDIINSYFKNLAIAGKIGEKQVVPATMAAREAVAGIVAEFNKTGQIAETQMAALRDMLGEAGDEVERLLRLQLEYNQALAVIEGAEGKMAAIGERYQEEVAAIKARGDLTEEQKRAEIWAAHERARAAEKAVQAEVDAAEDKREALADEIDWQKEYMGALGKTDALFAQQIQLIQKIASALEGVAGVGRTIRKAAQDRLESLEEQLALNQKLQAQYEEQGMDTTALLQEELRLREAIAKEKLARGIPIEADLASIEKLRTQLETTYAPLPDVSEKLTQDFQALLDTTTEWGESIAAIKTRFDEAGQTIDAFLLGIKNAPADMGRLSQEAEKAYTLGLGIRTTWDDIVGRLATAKEKATGFTASFAIPAPILEGLRILGAGFSAAASVITETVGPRLQRFLTKLGETAEKLGLDWGDAWTVLATIGKVAGGIIIGILLLLLAIATGVLDGIVSAFDGAIDGWTKFVTSVKDGVAEAIAMYKDIGDFISSIWAKDWEGAFEAAGKVIDHFKDVVGNILDAIVGLFEANLGFITGLVLGFIEGVVKFFEELYDDLVGGSIVLDLIDDIVAAFAALPELLLAALGGTIGKVLKEIFGIELDPTVVAETFLTLLANLQTLMETWNLFLESLRLGWDILSLYWLEENWPLLSESWTSMWAIMESVFLAAIRLFEVMFQAFVVKVIAGIRAIIVIFMEWIVTINNTRQAIDQARLAIMDLTGEKVMARMNKLIDKFAELKKAAQKAARACEEAAKACGGGGGAPPGGPPPPGAQAGIWNIARGMLVRVHKGESILPRGVAEPFREAMMSGAPIGAGETAGCCPASAGTSITINEPRIDEDYRIQELVDAISRHLGFRAEVAQRARGCCG